jgi:hypothetical protein
MMKQYKLPHVLDQEEDFDKFYNSPNPEKEKKENDVLPPHYADEKEANFYKDDVDFLRFHKRTTRNVQDAL